MMNKRSSFGQSVLLGLFSLMVLIASQLVLADGQVAEKKPGEKKVTVTTVKAPAKKSTKSRVKLDLNTAPVKQLMTLPGIDEELARRISAGRPYDSVQDLARVGVPAGTIDEITPLVKVRPRGTHTMTPPPPSRSQQQAPPPPPPPPAGSARPPSR
ncbi:MAG TPA: helix-hairpin-helix domain-containing protein [Acidobacteriota bacterium]|jgi:DNA uptake protein ComE-like DNA-binding protein